MFAQASAHKYVYVYTPLRTFISRQAGSLRDHIFTANRDRINDINP